MASGTGRRSVYRSVCLWPHVHPTDTVAVMASDTGTWGSVLSIGLSVAPCPFNRFGCRNGIRHGDMGRNSV
ncbi:hypothetical protein AVEN_63209-1, partial [Araneus ventricosus]